MKHGELVNEILIKYGTDKRLKIWKNHVGLFLTLKGTPMKVGIPGASDIFGIRHDGKFISIEVKVGADYLKDQQKRWGAMVLTMGGLWIVARKASDVEEIFKE